MDENFKNRKVTKTLDLELRKARQHPGWESSNEGIHERVNFEDTIWGFNLAGGSYYKTPLRVTRVKEDSRAQHAGIKVGDILRCINGLDTSTLTVQEAHDIILESGIEIKLELTAPDVNETMHYIYQDEIDEDDLQEKRRRELKLQATAKKFNGAKTNDAWSLAWPCSKKRDVLYRESNCFLVPSGYEIKHPEKRNPIKINKLKAEELNIPSEAELDHQAVTKENQNEAEHEDIIISNNELIKSIENKIEEKYVKEFFDENDEEVKLPNKNESIKVEDVHFKPEINNQNIDYEMNTEEYTDSIHEDQLYGQQSKNINTQLETSEENINAQSEYLVTKSEEKDKIEESIQSEFEKDDSKIEHYEKYNLLVDLKDNMEDSGETGVELEFEDEVLLTDEE